MIINYVIDYKSVIKKIKIQPTRIEICNSKETGRAKFVLIKIPDETFKECEECRKKELLFAELQLIMCDDVIPKKFILGIITDVETFYIEMTKNILHDLKKYKLLGIAAFNSDNRIVFGELITDINKMITRVGDLK